VAWTIVIVDGQNQTLNVLKAMGMGCADDVVTVVASNKP